jgi:hypothetical protein
MNASKKIAIVVDPYSSGALYASNFAKHGVSCIAIQSRLPLPLHFVPDFNPLDFIEVLSPSPSSKLSPSSSDWQSRSPSAELSPSSSDGLSRSLSDELSPSSSSELSPSSSSELSPSSSSELSPSSSSELSPSASNELCPSPSSELRPSPSDQLSPSSNEIAWHLSTQNVVAVVAGCDTGVILTDDLSEKLGLSGMILQIRRSGATRIKCMRP